MQSENEMNFINSFVHKKYYNLQNTITKFILFNILKKNIHNNKKIIGNRICIEFMKIKLRNN